MRRLMQKLFVLGAALALAANASAFSLMGPPASWQTPAIGYNFVGDVGGPMNLGEEYRITAPVLNYGYDATFLNFFGANGVAAIESAMAILNSVPAASAMSPNLAEFPVQAIGPANNTAANLQVFDLKSAALSTVLGQMGLASPERWTYALRDRFVIANTTNYTVIQRNFDPVNWRPTNVVNGVLYTYTVQDSITADAVETRVSGSANNRSVANADGQLGIGLGAGQFFTSLSRDDYGALRYLLRFNNVNVENLTAAGSVSLANTYSPFGPALGTNAFTNVPIALARRPGIGKVSFSPIPVDSLLGVNIRSVTNRYVDVFYHPTNFYLTNQTVERVTTLPDVLFTAGDLASLLVVFGVSAPPTLARGTSARWINNSALNTVGGGAGIVSGPGVIPAATSNATAIVITFNTLGPSRQNFQAAGGQRFLDERSSIVNGVWGYFDTTTIFSVFPDGLTIQDLERQLYGP